MKDTLSSGTLALLAASISVSLATNANADGLFPQLESFQIGDENLRGVLSVDFNGDSFIDLATIHGLPNDRDASLTVLLGNGDGTFGVPVQNVVEGVGDPDSASVVVAAPVDLAAGDFDGINGLDIIATFGGINESYVFLNNGDGTFTPDSNTYDAGLAPISIAVADFDNDSALDFAVASIFPEEVIVHYGQGDGTFGSDQFLFPAFDAFPDSVAAGDLDGDGRADLVLANSSLDNTAGAPRPTGVETLEIFLSTGRDFQNSVLISSGTTADDVVIADVNNDGRDDVILAHQVPSNIAIFLNTTANGLFSLANPIEIAIDQDVVLPDLDDDPGTSDGPEVRVPQAGAVAATDLDNDGHIDIAIISNVYGDLSVIRNLGNGQFELQRDTYFAGKSLTGEEQAIAFGDADGNGLVDLFVTSPPRGSINMLENLGGLALDAPVLLSGVLLPNDLEIIDFNSDGSPDIAVTQQDTPLNLLAANQTSVLFNDGTGRVGSTLTSLTGAISDDVVAGDFNQDGLPDLLVSNAQSTAVSLLFDGGNANNDSIITDNQPITTSNLMRPIAVATGDFNEDGIDDLLSASRVFPAVGYHQGIAFDELFEGDFFDSVPNTSSINALPSNGAPKAITVADFNGDAHLDFASTSGFRSSNSGVDVRLGNGDGTFQNQTLAPIAIPVGNTPQAIAHADFNGDGHVDLVTANQNDASATILLGDGTGTFPTRMDVPAEEAPSAVDTGDVNHDGYVDFIIANRDSDSVSVFLGNGDGVFQNQIVVFGGDAPTDVRIVDFNGDGAHDIVVVQRGTANGGGIVLIENKLSLGCSDADLAAPFGVLDFFDIATYLNLDAATGPSELQLFLDAHGAGCP